MATATYAGKRSGAARAMLVACTALALRRAWSLQQLQRCRAWQASRPVAPQTREATSALKVHVIVPLFQEQPLVPEIVGFWHARCAEDPSLHVQLVTTEKEGSVKETTAALVRQSLAQTSGR